MPTVGPGRISFTGVKVPLSATMTRGHGTAPSQGTLEFLGQDDPIPATGTLSLECDGTAVVFPDCRIGRVLYQRDSSQGKVVTVQILDRRWRWNDHQISGEYNVRKTEDSLEPGSERSPRQLAALLTRAIGEPIDLSAIPDDARPYVSWDNAAASDELDELCDQLNCRVVLGLDNVARIVRKNLGAPLPQSELRITLERSVEPPERPDILRVVGNYVKRQIRIPLEAVGLDIDGKIVPIDELLKKPPGGWSREWPEMPSISDKKFTLPDGSKTSPLELYRRSVYRWYRVKPDGIKVPDLSDSDPTIGDTVKRWQILPLLSDLGEEYQDADGRKHPRPAYVIGDWYGYTRVADTVKNNTDTRVTIGEWDDVLDFSIDAERGIVQFSEPLYLLDDGGGTLSPAKLWLYTAVIVRHPETRARERYYRDQRNGDGNRVHVFPHDDIKLLYRGQYDQRDQSTGNPNNLAQCNERADYYLGTAAQSYLTFPAEDAPYVGIHRIETDGAIQQVTWSVVQDQGASTQASRGYEANLSHPTYRDAQEQRVRRQTAQLAKQFAGQETGEFKPK